eukprot:7201692-Prymnesium_polylepis.1
MLNDAGGPRWSNESRAARAARVPLPGALPLSGRCSAPLPASPSGDWSGLSPSVSKYYSTFVRLRASLKP